MRNDIKYVKVEGINAVRDMSNGAIISKDPAASIAAKKRKMFLQEHKAMKEQIDTLLVRIEKLESEVLRLKTGKGMI